MVFLGYPPADAWQADIGRRVVLLRFCVDDQEGEFRDWLATFGPTLTRDIVYAWKLWHATSTISRSELIVLWDEFSKFTHRPVTSDRGGSFCEAKPALEPPT